MVGKFEAVLERAAGNAAMQIAVIGGLLLFAGDGQKIGLEGNVEIVLGKTCDRDRDAIAVVTGLDDVIGRPVADRTSG